MFLYRYMLYGYHKSRSSEAPDAFFVCLGLGNNGRGNSLTIPFPGDHEIYCKGSHGILLPTIRRLVAEICDANGFVSAIGDAQTGRDRSTGVTSSQPSPLAVPFYRNPSTRREEP